MAGNTNLAYRRLCRKFGAELTTTEMVSAKALQFSDSRTLAILKKGDDEHPIAAQIFGANPAEMADAAKLVEELGFDFADINMGCPVPKITGGGGGSSLLREPNLAAECIQAMVEACNIPVTIKIRSGWDKESENAPTFAQRMEESGAAAITIHGRTREQKYSGSANYQIISEVVNAVTIPVIGNGDVVDIESARNLLSMGVAGIAIGRAALGRPWFFAQLQAFINGQKIPDAPSGIERMNLLLELGSGVCELYGEERGMKTMRRLSADFFRESPGSAKLRAQCSQLSRLDELEQLAHAANAEPSQFSP